MVPPSAPLNFQPTDAYTAWHDSGLEIRRAARLAKEARRAQEEAILQTQRTADDLVSSSSKLDNGQPRQRNQIRTSRSASQTQRSRQTASQPRAAEAIMAFSRRNSSKHQEQSIAPTSPEEDITLDIPALPNVTTPEPCCTNIKTVLNSVPGLTPAASLEPVYEGDYSQWQLDPQSYLKGARGPRSTYAEIILNHNPTVSSESQKVLITTIKRATKEI